MSPAWRKRASWTRTEPLIETAVKRFPDVIHTWMQWASIAGHGVTGRRYSRRWGEKLWNNEIDLGIGAGGSRAV